MKNDRSNIIKEYKKKLNLIKKYNELYYGKDSPSVSDSEYDKLKSEIVDIENENKFLKQIGSVTEIIGTKPTNKFKKIKHIVPMLSLSNAFNIEDMKDFLKKINNYLNYKENTNFDFSGEPKIDGISASLNYENGELKKGLSRGDGKVGEDILKNLITIKQIPKKIVGKNIPKKIEIRGEVYIGKKDFELLKDNFANPRNAAG